MKESTASLVVTLNGDSSIDANTLINVLASYVAIAEQSNEIIGEGAYKVKVNVKALNKCCFQIDMEVVSSWIENLINPQNISYAANIVTAIGGAFKMFKKFKGKKVSKQELNNATKDSNVVINIDTFNVYNDPIVREAFRKSTEAVKDDGAVDSITVCANGEVGDTITEEEFPDLIIPPTEDIPNENVIIKKNVSLVIVSLSFQKGNSWEFIYDGNKIKTKLADDGLQEAIEKGDSFAKGDCLVADMEITQIWKPEYNAYANKRYKIVTVHDHVPRPKQQKMYFE